MITLHSGLGPAWIREKQSRRLLARAVLAQYRKVIAVSAAIRDSLHECGVADVEVLPAFSRHFLHPGAPPAGLPEFRKGGSPLFCAMIAPRPEYGEPVLLAAFSQVLQQLPSAKLALYGPGSEQVRAANVHGFGELQRPQALALMQACDIFVRPTLADGDSVSVREALALGRSVIATDVGTRPPEVRLVPANDAHALAREMLAARAPHAVPAVFSDSFDRILSLYGFPEDRCAASAAT
jgi:glycosyltransferase involved in cell wall biosynthesis